MSTKVEQVTRHFIKVCLLNVLVFSKRVAATMIVYILMKNTIFCQYFDLNQIQVRTVTHKSIQSILAHSHPIKPYSLLNFNPTKLLKRKYISTVHHNSHP